MTAKIIKCAACGFEYDEAKPSWEQEGEYYGEFIMYEVKGHRLGFDGDEEFYILVCPKCKTLRYE